MATAEIQNLKPIDYTDCDSLIKDAWQDAKNVKDPFMRLQVKLKLAALRACIDYGIDYDVTVNSEEN